MMKNTSDFYKHVRDYLASFFSLFCFMSMSRNLIPLTLPIANGRLSRLI